MTRRDRLLVWWRFGPRAVIFAAVSAICMILLCYLLGTPRDEAWVLLSTSTISAFIGFMAGARWLLAKSMQATQ